MTFPSTSSPNALGTPEIGDVDRPQNLDMDSFKYTGSSHSRIVESDMERDEEDDDGWDTAQEGVAGDSEREAARQKLLKLKGKQVETYAPDIGRDSQTSSTERISNGRGHPPSLGTRTRGRPMSYSSPPSAGFTSGFDSDANLRLPNSGPRSPSLDLLSDRFQSDMAAIGIPSVNVIPNSPTPHNGAFDIPSPSREPSPSLDIPHTISPMASGSRSHEALRRRETVNAVSPTTSERRNNRRRSLDPRSNGSRLSGFFSNLLHIRSDHDRASSTSITPSSSAGGSSVASASRTPRLRRTQPPTVSPAISLHGDPPLVVPPPALPPPTLHELGLSFQEVTPFIHTTPQAPNLPLSGVFLAPHYLLLCHNQGLDVVCLKYPPLAHPFALIRRVVFKSVVVMEERGVLVAIAGRREGVRVYALDEVRKAVEWRVQVEIERERDAGLMGSLMGRRSLETRFERSLGGSGPRLRLPMGIGVPGLNGMIPMAAQEMRSTSNPVTPVSETPSESFRERSRSRTRSMPTSPPPAYSSLIPPLPQSPRPGPSGLVPSPTITSPPTDSTLEVIHTPASLSVEDPHTLRPRNASVSTIAAGRPGQTIASAGNGKAKEKERAKEASGDDQMGEKELDWIDRHGDSDDEALDPVAAGSSGSAALDERTSAITSAAMAADTASAGVVGIPVNPVIASSPLLGPPTTSSLGARRPSRPSNLDLSTESLGPSSLPVATSEPSEPTLMSLRQALALAGSVGIGRRSSFIPREPRASTSLSLDGVDEGSGAETPQEVGEDFISFTQAIAESRVETTEAPLAASPTSFTQTGSSSMTGVFRPPVSASAALASLGKAQGDQSIRRKPTAQPSSSTPLKQSTSLAPSPSATAEAKKRRRFSLMGSGIAKSESTSSTSVPRAGPPRMFTAPLSTGLAGASASTPNLTEALPSSASAPPRLDRQQVNGMPPNGTSIPSGSSTVGRSATRQRIPPSLNTVDRIFQPQANLSDQPPSPFKLSTPTSSTSLTAEASSSSAPQRSSRRFIPKLLVALRKTPNDKQTKEAVRVRSEVERRLAAGGASSAAIMAKRGDGFGPSAANGGPEILSNTSQGAAPKLEYVKLPGTKGAIAIKAVETPKKSFLAILCGDSGEKVELFAGTYRTALGLSRTFILPDSPRHLELQLQGDDLSELFLVFSQNVFGLEPATVRVREVRIGRAERRAARRRAREARGLSTSDHLDGAQSREDEPPLGTVVTSVVSVGNLEVAAEGRHRRQRSDGPTVTTTAPADPAEADGAGTPGTPVLPLSSRSPEELAALAAAAQFGPYTTFQQLTFSPRFPLSSIADDSVIPPTYANFISHRVQHEPDAAPIIDLLSATSTPASLEPSASSTSILSEPAPPPKWFYKDPKGVIQGPWKSSLMQTWLKDGFLPPELPIRREMDSEFVLLKDLCQSVPDAEYPFEAPPTSEELPLNDMPTQPKPLLPPISLLELPRRSGPPALFYTTRGGHSTSIVDPRGKSVLKGRLNWSRDEETFRLGDVKRLEAFDVDGRAVIVALRQGGLEAVDIGDALCYPGDDSRGSIPHYHADASNVSRRPNFKWKLGDSVGDEVTPTTDLPANSSKRGSPSTKKATSSGITSARPLLGKFEPGTPDDPDAPLGEEVLYIGRYRDTVYICERTLTSFRILSLGPSVA